MYGLIYDNHFSTCTKCAPNCLDCNDNAGTCKKCFSTRYLSDSGKCETCGISNCKACQSGQCVQCFNLQTLVDGKCVNCQDNCVTCANKAPTVCTSCISFLYGALPDNKGDCVVCDNECLSCNPLNTSICLKC